MANDPFFPLTNLSKFPLVTTRTIQQNPNNSDSVKIFVAAIFVFVLALLILLIFICRFLLRHLTNAIIINISASQSQPTSGLPPSLLAEIPTFAYVTSPKFLTECVVCLSLVEEGETVRMLPNCKHVFHVECVDMWLHAHSTCPVCQTAVKLVEEEVEGVVRGGARRLLVVE